MRDILSDLEKARDEAAKLRRDVRRRGQRATEMRAEIARLRAALEWYAEMIAVAVQSTDETECLSAIGSLSRDAGARARRALDGKEADGE